MNANQLVEALLENDFAERDPHELTRFKERDPAGFNLTPEQQTVFDKWYGELTSAIRSAYEDHSVYMFFIYQAMRGVLKDLGWPDTKAHLVRDYFIQRLDDDGVFPYDFKGGKHARFLKPKDRPSKAKKPAVKPKGWMVGDSTGTAGGIR